MTTSKRMPAWGTTSLVLGLFALAGAAAWLLVPPQQEALVLLKVSANPPSVLGEPQNAAEEFAIFKRTQVQLLLSNPVLAAALRDSRVAALATIQAHPADAPDFLRASLRVDYPDDAEILRIRMTGTRGEDLVAVVDSVVKAYLAQVVERERDKRLDLEAKLQSTLTAMNADMQKKADAVRALEALHKTSGSAMAKLKKQLAVDELNRMIDHRTFINTQIKENNMQFMLLSARRQNPDDNQLPDSLVETVLNKDPIVVNSQQQLMMAQEQLQALRTKDTNADTDPESSAKAGKLVLVIKSLEERINERKNHLRPSLVELLAAARSASPRVFDHRAISLSLPQLEKQRDYLAEQLKEADKAIENQLAHVEVSETYSAQVLAAQEELRATKETTTNLRSELDRIKIEKLAPERITQVHKAVLVNSADNDQLRRYLNAACAGLVGLVLVALGVFSRRNVES